MNYAIIEETKVVEVVNMTFEQAAAYPNAVSIDNYAVQVGDSYINGKFYQEVLPLHSLEYQLIAAQEELIDAKTALETLGYTEEE